MLILAAVSFNLVLGDNGIINKAKEAKEKTQIAAIIDSLELEKVNLVAETRETSLELSSYIEKLIKKGIITDDVVENTEYDDSKLITVNGYVFLLTEQNGDIKIELQGKKGDIIIVDRTKPVVTIDENTVNTISITITDNSSGVVGYAYSKTNNIPQNFISCEKSLKISIVINNLDENTTYYIWTKDEAGNVSEAKTATTSVANYSLNSGVKYNTLAEAVESAVAGDTIKLISDYTDTSDIVINKNITFDTNGKTLVRTKAIEIASGTTVEISGEGTLTTAEKINLIENKGVLNITHRGIISNTNTGDVRVINNSGTVNKTGAGTIECAGTKPTIAEGNINISNGRVISTGYVGVYTSDKANILNDVTISGIDNALFLVGSATATVSGGTLTASKYDGIYTGNNSSVTVNGGTIEGLNSGIYHESTGSIYVNDGNLIGETLEGIRVAKNGTGNIEITGGKIEGANNAMYTQGNVNINISGGSFIGNKYSGICIDDKSENNLTITAGNLVGKGDCGIWIGEGCKSSVKIKNVTITAYNHAIYVRGKADIEISGGSFTSENQCGIYMQEQGEMNLTVTGGTLIGNGYYGIGTVGSNSIINVYGGVIEGEHTAIGLYNGGNNLQLNVFSGSLTGRQYDGIAVYANATVNVGNSAIEIDNNSLNIYGKNFGVIAIHQ